MCSGCTLAESLSTSRCLRIWGPPRRKGLESWFSLLAVCNAGSQSQSVFAEGLKYFKPRKMANKNPSRWPKSTTQQQSSYKHHVHHLPHGALVIDETPTMCPDPISGSQYAS